MKPVTTESLPASEAIIERSDVIVKQTVLHIDVHADQWSYPVRSYISVMLTAKIKNGQDTFASNSEDDV